jgi:transcriptional regulator with XRE-family HTH domain
VGFVPETRTIPHDGEKIRELREAAGLNLVELGKLTRRHPQSLRNIELGKTASVVTLARIAKALKVDLVVIADAAPAPDCESARRAS